MRSIQPFDSNWRRPLTASTLAVALCLSVANTHAQVAAAEASGLTAPSTVSGAAQSDSPEPRPGGLIGAGLDHNWRCDDPGLQGFVLGAPIGAVVGGILGFVAASR